MKGVIITTTALLLTLSFNTIAEESADDGIWASIKNNVKETWNSPTRDLYVPLNTWHNRATYDKEKTDSYNERPWGIGYGVSRFDSDGNWHSIYAMEFQDSHNQIEPIIGYGYQKNWYLGSNNDWRLGLGFTAAVTARHEYNYIPIPLPLPLFSIEYKKFAIQNTYIPGTYNNGNVLFTWARWQF
ncbi:lipid A palmitoyltransferase PagP [Pragia fontium]|uniref:Lipid A acyltransferase PagP n=1 Tax=Pragia fontium TaxID=82985 RepID=A0ABQ5LLG6_9GAMM|nr:lipid IV(A) palmitoyltransferase PagP [Pragia fontium]GKX63836.1 lipid A palmitoyltransferase PagP [Pragia fontium]